jgi:hypothetical protein
MSKGVILFAFNTDTCDYFSIAEKNTKLIHKFLNLPVTVITDSTATSPYFDTIVIKQSDHQNKRLGLNGGTLWRNFDRYKVYDYTPYDTTLLLDSDYLPLTSNLLKYFDLCKDYLLLKEQIALNSQEINLGIYNLPQYWATIILFNKTNKTKLLFNLVERIQKNYEYYKNLYQIKISNYRNDFSFTIANNIVNGYQCDDTNCIFKTNLIIQDEIKQLQYTDDLIYLETDKNKVLFPKFDLHLLDKNFFFNENYDKFIEQILV